MSALDLVTEEKNGVLIIKFPGVLEATASEEMEKHIKMWLIKDIKLFVFDFGATLHFDHNLYKSIIHFKKNLQKVEKTLATISVSQKLKSEFNTAGIGHVFNIQKNLNEAYVHAGIRVQSPKKIQLDTNFINPFIKGAQITFETQVGLKITAGKPFIKKANELPGEFAIAGIINLTCAHFTGAVSIVFSKSTFLNIYNKMLDENISEITDEVKDGAGELLNIIYGLAKKELNELGYRLEKAIPTILYGSNIKVHSNKNCPTIALPFQSESGEFFIEVNLSTDS